MDFLQANTGLVRYYYNMQPEFNRNIGLEKFDILIDIVTQSS